MDPMKLLLLGAAGALVYLSTRRQEAGTGPGTAPPATNGTATTTAPAGASTGPTGSNAPSSTPNPGTTALMRAAANSAWAGEAGNYTQNLHQWNWYRAKYQMDVAGNPNPDPAVFTPAFDDIADPSRQYTAMEYHSLLARKGLSGLTWAPRLPYGAWGDDRGVGYYPTVH